MRDPIDIAIKSTGQLVDELVTNAFKTAFAISSERPTTEFDARFDLLRAEIDDRFGCPISAMISSVCYSLFTHREPPCADHPPQIHADMGLQLRHLCAISLATWQAQEVVVHETDDTVVAAAARTAQRCNAKRTAAIRTIDRLLCEDAVTITTKTYG